MTSSPPDQLPSGRAPRPDDVLVVIGTRPEAVKLVGVVTALGERARIVHTGQHYDTTLWSAVARGVGLPEPDVCITVGGTHRGEQIGTATTALTRHLLAYPARAVVVQGDTNSTLAGALAGTATQTPVVHVEAGLRSGDLTMPEEGNRLLVDRIADLCCAPTEHNAAQLRREGVAESRIAVTGNTLFDALRDLLPGPVERAEVRASLGLVEHEYALVTVHRESNVEDPVVLSRLLESLARLAERTQVVLPLHPRTRAAAERAGLTAWLSRVLVLPPVSPADFLALEHGAGLLVSDSGGVQEEACFLRRPLLVLRDSTERPELLDRWCELLGDRDPRDAVVAAWERAAGWAAELVTATPPYQAAGASERIVAALQDRLAAPVSKACGLPGAVPTR